MPTVIEALVVTLGLDPKGIKTGADEANASLGKTDAAAKKTAKTISEVEKAKKAESKATSDAAKVSSAAETKASKEMEARGKTMALAFSKIRNEALALVGVFTAGMGIKNFAESTIGGAASLGLMSANLNMSTEKLSAWQRAAERAGGTAEGMTAQLQESASESAKARAGEGTATSAKFYAMGGDSKALKDGNTFLLARAQIVSELYKTDKARAQLVASQMGISEQQFNLIKQGPAAILALVAAQEKNSAISDKQAAQALILQNRWLDLRDRLRVVGTTILIELLPTFEKLILRFQKFADWTVEHKDDIKKWVNDAVEAIVKFAKMVDAGAESIGGWKVVLTALLALKVVSMVAPLLSLAGALASIGTALGAIGLLGPAALVALAGFAGYKLGGVINDHLSDDTKNGIGEFIARTLASLGNKEAGEAIRLNTGKDDYGTGPAQSSTLFKGLESKYKLPSGLLDSVWAQESGRGKNMRSKAGAKGHFQFMDATAKQYGLQNPDDLGQSAQAAAHMYSDLLKKYNGNVPKALAAYNWGQGNVDKNGLSNAPTETKNYIGQITGRMNASQGMANAENAANLPSGARAAAPIRSGSTSTSSAETNINGPITIQTAATDADGIAKDFAASMRNYSFVSQANTGLS